MNWMRYQGSTRRLSRRDREQWVHDKLQEAIELKREQIRLGNRPKLTRTSIDPKKSYFLRRLIHVDKVTGGVTWKLFEDSPLTPSKVSSISTQPRRRPDKSSRRKPRTAGQKALPSLKDGIQYSQNTQTLAREIRYTAAEERQWVARMMEVCESEDENSESDSSFSEVTSGKASDTSTATASLMDREEPSARRASDKKVRTPRKSFSAKEIYAMVPTDSPDLNELNHLSRKRRARKRRKKGQATPVKKKPTIESPEESRPDIRVPFKEASGEPTESFAETSESLYSTQSILVSKTSSSSSRGSQTRSLDHSVSGSISETVSSCSESESSDESSQNTTSLSLESAERRNASKVTSPSSTDSGVTTRNSGSASTASSPKSMEALCGSVAAISSVGIQPSVTSFKSAPIDVTVPLLSQFGVSCRIEADRGISSTFNVTTGAEDPTNRSVMSRFRSLEVNRGSFASRTVISGEQDRSDRGLGAHAVAKSVRCNSRVEVRNRMGTNREVITPSAKIGTKRLVQESRGAFASRVSISRSEDNGNSVGSSVSAAASILFTSRLDVSSRVETHLEAPFSAASAVTATRQSMRTLEVSSAHSVAPNSRIVASAGGSKEPVAARRARRNVSDAQTSRSSVSTLPSGSSYSRNPERPVRKTPRKKISRKKQGSRTSPDLSYLPGLFLSPEVQSGFLDDCEASRFGSPSSGDGTQTFTPSLAGDKLN